MTIYCYDHGDTKKPWGKIFEIRKKKGKLQILYSDEVIKNSKRNDIVFLHANRISVLKWCEAVISNKYLGELVVVRSDGGETFIDKNYNNERIHISKLTPIQFNSIADDFLNSAFKNSFNWELLCPQNHHIISSLAILCQGYIAVLANENGKVDVPDPEKKIAKAHDVMDLKNTIKEINNNEGSNWLKIIFDKNYNIQSLREMVTKKDYWNIFSIEHNHEQETCESIIDKTVNEWKQGKKSLVDFMVVKSLIQNIFDPPINDHVLVAEAFLKIANWLETRDV